MKRVTRQTTRKAVETGASPGLVSPMHTTSNKLRGGPSTIELGASFDNYKNTIEPPSGPGPTGMDGISFDTHQSRYEHDIDSPLPENHITSARARQQPKKEKRRPKKRSITRKAAIRKATTSTSPGGSDKSTSSGSNSTSSGDSVIVRDTVPPVPSPNSEIPTLSAFGPHAAISIGPPNFVVPVVPTAPVTPQPAVRGIKPSSDTSNAPQRQCNTPFDKGKGRAPDEETKTWRTTNICKDSPEEMEDIQVTGGSQRYQASPEGMSICSPDLTPGRAEFLRKKYQEFEEMKKQIGDLTLQNAKAELALLKRKESWESLKKQAQDLTEENEQWRKIRTGTINRIRPLAALLKVISDDFHVNRENDVDYIHWRNVLRC